MPASVIKVEDLGKKYIIRHEQRGNYLTLRDVVTDKARQAGKIFTSRLRPLPISQPAAKQEEFWALKGVSFEVNQGDRVGIIGRNGAGKSTLLKVLSRITEPTTGRISIKGRVASLLEVGTGFHPELTGRENIFLNGAILGMGKAEIKSKFDEIVDFAEVEKFLDTPVKFYSSGMYVRLAFAVAAHLEPEILVVDEVLAVGDAQFQKKCLGKMEDVSLREGRTVLFVSHNMGAIQRFCSSAVWLEQGRVAEVGNAAHICERYLFSSIEESSGSCEFEDGMDSPVRFLSLELTGTGNKPTNTFRADEPIKFRITYEIDREISGLSIAVNITDGVGASLWGVSDLDLFPELFQNRNPGRYVYECVAPGQVLRPGIYNVALGAGAGGTYFHHPRKQVFFEITTSGYWRHSHRFFGVGGGPIAVPMAGVKPRPAEKN